MFDETDWYSLFNAVCPQCPNVLLQLSGATARILVGAVPEKTACCHFSCRSTRLYPVMFFQYKSKKILGIIEYSVL